MYSCNCGKAFEEPEERTAHTATCSVMKVYADRDLYLSHANEGWKLANERTRQLMKAERDHYRVALERINRLPHSANSMDGLKEIWSHAVKISSKALEGVKEKP